MSVHRATHAPFRPYRKAALLALSVALASGPVVLVAVSSADAAPTTGALISRAPSRYQVISSGRPLELGLRFSVKTAGWVTGVRVFKGSTAASATPVSGSLWSSSGQRLASAAFKQTTGTGWQSVTFSRPVQVIPGPVYTASVFTPTGDYVRTRYGFLWRKSTRYLSAPPRHNGVYKYTPYSAFPHQSYRMTNYWVDAQFRPAPAATHPPTVPDPVTHSAPVPTASSALPSSTSSTSSATVKPTETTAQPTHAPPTYSSPPTSAPTHSSSSPTSSSPTSSSPTSTSPTSSSPTTVPSTNQPGSMPGWKVTASNTGLAPFGLSCSSLPVYTGSTKPAAGSVISQKRILTSLNLSAGDITIEKSCVQPTTAGQGLPLLGTMDYNNFSITPRTVTIRDSEIDGSLLGSRLSALVTGFIGIADLQNNYIHDVGSGIGIMNAGPKLSGVIEGNYVTKLRAWGDPRTDGNHSDGFTVRDFSAAAGRQLIVRNNRFDCNSGNDTGALFIQTYSGNIDNVVIEGNLLEGATYQLVLGAGYGHHYSNMSAINNRMSGTGYGAGYVADGPGWSSQSGNAINDPSQPDNRGRAVTF
jgi:hypothetical protein